MKNKKIIFIVTSVLVIILIAVASTFAITSSNLFGNDAGKKNNKNKTEVKEDNAKETKRELNEEEKNVLLKNIEEVYNENFIDFYPIKDINDISNQAYLFFANRVNGRNSTKDNFDNTMKTYFGTKKLTHENILCEIDNIPLYNYNEETGEYTFNNNHPGHGLPLPGGTKVYYVSGTITNEKDVEINTHILYANYCGDVCIPNAAYYKSYEESFNGTPLFGDPNNMEEYNLTEDDYNKVKDSLPIATYNFTKTDDKYSLVSVAIK